MTDEAKKPEEGEGISSKLFGRKKREKPASDAQVMEEPEAMTLEEPMPEPPPPAPTKKASAPAAAPVSTMKSSKKLAGHPVARKKHRDLMSERKGEAAKYLGSK
jgi:hypothetical protein